MFQILLIIIYLAFISLGLPDALLGSAWPSMYTQLDVPLSYAGILSMIIALGTIFSSLKSDYLTKSFGPGIITFLSVGMTALALFGFSISHSFVALCFWAIPYGLGAGSVDAALNNYVALNYKSRHMSWLHCMWGVGASLGPYLMGKILIDGENWGMGYFYISLVQIMLTLILMMTLPLWKKDDNLSLKLNNVELEKPLKLTQIITFPGAKEIMITFFSYCALEQTVGLWGTSYLVIHNNIKPEIAAQFASLFFIGITLGRAVSGFLTFFINNLNMVRLGQFLIVIGSICLFIPFGNAFAEIGLILIGLGCAPIYPSVLHSTPERFGAKNSQALIGVQMASAYIGTCFMPPLFGIISQIVSIGFFPIYILLLLFLMIFMHEQSVLKSQRNHFVEESND